MIRHLIQFLGGKRQKNKGLADFFLNTRPQEQKRILEEAAHAANKEQQMLLQQYEKTKARQ